MAKLHDHVEYVKLVKDVVDEAKANGKKLNEEATKNYLLAPFFTMLGYDLADPKECVHECAAQFGTEHFSTRVDWVFCREGSSLFMVEAKALGEPLQPAWTQLFGYFAEQPALKVGILTNGAEWRFYTDVNRPNVMDHEPFARWDIYSDEPAPSDVLNLLRKTKFDAETIQEFAKKTQKELTLMFDEVSSLLAPSEEFIKLAIKKETIEPHSAGSHIVAHWKPIVAKALSKWAAAGPASLGVSDPPNDEKDEGGGHVEPTQDELTAFGAVKKALGTAELLGGEARDSYFKIHLPEKPTWVFTRLQLRQTHPTVWVPLPPETTNALAGGRHVTQNGGWSIVSIAAGTDLVSLGGLFRAAYEHVKKVKLGHGA